MDALEYRAVALLSRGSDAKMFHDTCRVVSRQALGNVQARRLEQILREVDGKARGVRADLRRPLSVFRYTPQSILVFATPPAGGPGSVVRLTADHENPGLAVMEMRYRGEIALPVGCFKRMVSEMIALVREEPVDLRNYRSFDHWFYATMRDSCAAWVGKTFPKKELGLIRDLLGSLSASQSA